MPTETGYSSAAYTEPIVTFHQGDLLQSLLGLSDSKSEAGLSVRGFREIGLLLETFRALSSIPLLDDVLALVVDTAIELTGAERGFIMLKDKQFSNFSSDAPGTTSSGPWTDRPSRPAAACPRKSFRMPSQWSSTTST